MSHEQKGDGGQQPAQQPAPSIGFERNQPADTQTGKIQAKGSYALAGGQLESIKLRCAATPRGRLEEKVGTAKDGKWNCEIKPMDAGKYRVWAELKTTDGRVFGTEIKSITVE